MNEPLNEIPAPPPAPTLPDDLPSNEARQWALFTHLSALLGLLIPFGNLLGPLIFWQLKKNEMPFADDQGKEALNFQITVMIAVIALIVIGTILLIVVVGVLFYFAAFIVGLVGLVLAVIAGIRANNGEYYRYPFTWRLVK